MKYFVHLITISLFLFSTTTIVAQKATLSAKKPSIQQTKGALVKICQLKMFVYPDGKTNILVDFGKTDNMGQEHIKEIKLESYNKNFDNIVDALRYMSKRNWRILETYEIQEEKNRVIYFILNRR